jgi:circadian clock protein KaiB
MAVSGAAAPDLPELFKGIAVFTPGGDVVYCRDPHKRSRWHLNLCGALQAHLGLSEPPHFLVPCFTATVDRWIAPGANQVSMVAEATPWVLRYQALLNALFDLGPLEWQPVYTDLATCSLSVLETYRAQFPQLWQDHDLVLDVSADRHLTEVEAETTHAASTGPVLKLFVSGHSVLTERILKVLQEVLETTRHRPYTLKVIDVSKHPEQAEAAQISATPTLVRAWPLPVHRLVGELNNPRAILHLLDDY